MPQEFTSLCARVLVVVVGPFAVRHVRACPVEDGGRRMASCHWGRAKAIEAWVGQGGRGAYWTFSLARLAASPTTSTMAVARSVHK